MRRKILPYDARLKERARLLCRNSTLSEVLLWRQLKGKQMLGFDFHRQKPIATFIVDFFCNELMLAIEIDGSSHNDRLEKDESRQRRLEELGITVLRLLDRDVKDNLSGVIVSIREWIVERGKRNS